MKKINKLLALVLALPAPGAPPPARAAVSRAETGLTIRGPRDSDTTPVVNEGKSLQLRVVDSSGQPVTATGWVKLRIVIRTTGGRTAIMRRTYRFCPGSRGASATRR